jgi:hypothetical protein
MHSPPRRSFPGGFRRQQAVIDQKTVGRAEGQFEILVADVEVEEAVIRRARNRQLAGVSPEAHFAAEALHLVEGRDAVGLAVENNSIGGSLRRISWTG